MRTKKLWNQMLSILLVIALLPVSALAELRLEDTAHPDVVNRFTASVSHVNPEYARLGVRFPQPTADCMTMADSTVDSLDEAAEYLREQMEDRVTQVCITIPNYKFIDGDTMNADWMTILYGAFAHTGVPTQGDYILRHYGKCAGNLQYSSKVGATFSYTITYDTTQNQENKVEEKIDELFTAWDAECGFYDLSDYEQVKVIYDYICENVVYDYDNLLNLNYTLKYSAYAALINGTAVCQGYANLFYRMALEAGIDTRIIVGDGGGPHSWNIVDLGEKYYYLDATWDAPRAEKDYPYEYFLLGSDNFCVDHTPEADNVLDCDVTTYPIDTADYDPDTALLTEATEAGLLRYFDTVTMDTELTRLAAAKLIVALAELELDTTATLPFDDCAGLTEEEQQIIATVCQAGLMSGYDATTFQPANTLTRAMVAVILYRAMNGGVDDEDIWDYADDGLFSDIGNSKWYTPYVNYLASIGVIPTSEDGKFHPNDTAILRHILHWAVNATNMEQEEPELPEIPENIIASGTCGGEGDGTNLSWTLTEDGTLTISGEGAMEDYDNWYYDDSGYNPKRAPWYDYIDSISSASAENGVTSIGNGAFYGCDSLTSVTIPNSVTTIGDDAFYFCNSLTSVTIPASVTTIGDYAFGECNNLTSVTIPDSVTTIGNFAFSGCRNLTSVTIPNSVTTIGNAAFQSCWNLTSITIPDSVTTIGDGVFSSCSRMSNIFVSSGNPNYCDVDGVLFNKNMETLIEYPSGKTADAYQIPDTVVTIGNVAFQSCQKLISITIPNSVTTISRRAFNRCNALKTVYYGGTEEQWNAISIDKDNDPLLNAEIIFEGESVHVHTEQVISGYDATCTEDGLTDGIKCSVCGEVLVAQEVVPALGHTEEVISGYDATCTEDGLTDGTKCSICGEILVAQEIIPATGHTEEVVYGYDATCTEDGLTNGTKCSVCGEILVAQEIIPALGHEFDEGVVTTEPTCTESGIKTYICLREGCDHSFTESIPSTGHIDENGDYICDDCGENLCTEHIEEIISGYDATCTEDGLTDGVKCATCGTILVEQEIIPAKGHTEEVIHGYDATCTTDGLTDGTKCSTCGEVLVTQEIIPAKGHTEEVISGYDATCTEDGLTDGVQCSICGEVLVAQEVIPANGHTEEVIYGYDATCTTDGLTDGTMCSTCGEVLVAQEIIPAKGHTEEVIHGYDATCTTDGLTDGTKCSVCGEVLVAQEIIPAEGHTEEVIHGYDATCTEDGLTDGTKCSICGEILVEQEIIPATGHTEEVIPGYPATLTAPGLTDGIKCSVCGEILVAQEEIPALTEISGTCGENLTWTLTNEGVLTISGAGAMYNFATVVDLSPLAVVPMNEETAVPAPWSEYATLITNVVVADGVTSIGDNAFAACENLTEVEIPKTVTAIGDNVFTGCEALETVTYTGTEEQWAEITRGEGNEMLENAEVVTKDVVLGDINGDGNIDSIDLTMLYDCAMGWLQLTEAQMTNGDIDGDFAISGTDIAILYDYLMGWNNLLD